MSSKVLARVISVAALAVAAPALGTDLRDPCFDRPGRLTPPCIVDAGHVAVEAGAVDYSRDRASDTATDRLGVADIELRVGLTDRLEAVGAWSPYNHARVKSRGNRKSSATSGVGDIMFGLKQSLLAPDGKGVSIAVQPFATAPTAKDIFGAGGWTQGLIVPVSIDLANDITLGLSPEIDRLPDGAGHGHHAAYTGVVGLNRAFGAVTPGIELYVSRDDDPGDRSTEATADVFVAYVPPSRPDVQFDAGINAGLNHDTPDVELSFGVSTRF